jgi:hypothetical protein
MLVRWLPLAVLMAGCSSTAPPGSGENHPIIWIVGMSAAFCLLSIGGWMVTGMLRRWERRADRHD